MSRAMLWADDISFCNLDERTMKYWYLVEHTGLSPNKDFDPECIHILIDG